MSTTAPPAAPERKARCRYRDRFDNPCANEVADDDPASIQLCPSHALRAVQMLAEAGVIRYQLANPRRSA
ncbi:hypothetical protein [Actinoallomurus sp. CA-142502]|uniref:hypothetical protein n=1 Tax=Actinoallomurus sp. CA-142502 TaxID=3239885 RepID=UPI003D8D032F